MRIRNGGDAALAVEVEVAERLSSIVADDEAGIVRLIDRPGGGKRRGEGMGRR